jgi:hypothetical protein
VQDGGKLVLRATPRRRRKAACVTRASQSATATIIFSSTVIWPDSDPMPTADRACPPTSGPNTEINKSEQPLIAMRWAMKSGAALQRFPAVR